MSFSPSDIASRLHTNHFCHAFIARVELPIESIYGFPVSAVFVRKHIRSNSDGVFFEITSSRVGKNTHKLYSALLGFVVSPEKTEAYIRTAYETIRYFVFDKLSGQFIDSRSAKSVELPFIPELEGIPFVNLSYQICPNCLHYTKTKTACNHPLCLECWLKIPGEEAYIPSTDEVIEYYPCPTCK